MNSYIAKTSIFKYIKPILICALLVWLIVPIFILIYYILLAKSDKVTFNGQEYRIEVGVFSKKVTNREITKILAVNNEQSAMGKIFNFGNVFCQTPEGFGCSFDYVKNPSGLKNYLEELHNRGKKASYDLI